MSWRIFNKYSEYYDSWFIKNYVTALNETRLLKTFDIKHPSLEVGVGTGFFASQLDVDYGVDPSYNMLLKARYRGVESILSLGEYLPFRSGSLNTVLMIVTLCFLDKPMDVLKEIYRVLVSGGNIIICIVPRDSIWGRRYIEEASKGHRFYRYARFYTVDEAIKMLRESLFKISSIRGILSYGPDDEPLNEHPIDGFKEGGFVCIEGIKV